MKTNLLRNTLAAIAALFTALFALPQQAQAQTKEAYLVEDGTTLTFYYDANKASRTGTVYGIDQKRTDATWIPAWAGTEDQNKRTTKVVFDASFRDYKPTNTSLWFSYCTKLATIEGMENLSTDQVTSMCAMFSDCSALAALDLSNFNTENVTNMSAMFASCSALAALDLSKFNTEKVTAMTVMFSDCSALATLDLSSFNTAKATDMSSMFYGCSALATLDLSSFNTAKATDMSSMFYGCKALATLDLSNFNTANVTDMSAMFASCSALAALDLSKFNTENVTNMSLMFSDCSALATIYCNDDWQSGTVENSNDMFNYCTKLKGAVPYDDAKTDISMANPITGYFTKNAPNAISAVTADTPQKKQGTYTLHGVRLGTSPDRLPAGIYIVDGKKVVKK